jgi:dienelactone hydrolase
MSRTTRVASSLIAAAVAAAIAAAPGLAQGPLPGLHERCFGRHDAGRVVHFRAADGFRLAGVVYGTGNLGVVLANQTNTDLCAWVPFARLLAGRGYRALAFDFRGYGSSPGTGRLDYDADVAAAAKTLRREGATAIVLIGASLGGTASLVASSRIAPPVDGVVDLSGPAVFGKLDAVAAARGLRVPLIVVVARGDSVVADDLRTFRAAATAEKQLVTLSGYDHGVDLVAGSQGRRVRSLIFRFLDRVS